MGKIISLFLLISFPLFPVMAKDADDPIVYSREFRDALTYIFAHRLYWRIWSLTDGFLNYDPDAEGWKIYPKLGQPVHGRISRKGNCYLWECDDLPSGLNYITLSHEKDGTWKCPGLLPDQGSVIPVCGDYEFRVPLSYIETASKFGKDTGPVVEKLKAVLKTLITQWTDAEVGTHHLFIGPFSNYVFPGRRDIVIYWKEGDTLIFVSASAGKDISEWDIGDFEILSLKSIECLLSSGNPHNEGNTYRECKTCEADARSFHTSLKVANCVRDGIMLTIEKAEPSPTWTPK